jgi:hypothetical protein
MRQTAQPSALLLAGVNNARLQFEVKREFSIFQVIFEMEIPGTSVHVLRNLGKREIVGRQQANSPTLHQCFDHQAISTMFTRPDDSLSLVSRLSAMRIPFRRGMFPQSLTYFHLQQRRCNHRA